MKSLPLIFLLTFAPLSLAVIATSDTLAGMPIDR